MTAQSFPDRAAIFVWHFGDGTKAYSRQGEFIGDLGRLTGYLVSQQAPELEDRDRRKIQPLSKANFPTRVELWIGEAGEETGYVPEVQGDHACFGAASIEVGRFYPFSECP
jgi:flagellar basal body rod protein FlgG